MATLYAPYKAIGYVTDGPFVINRLGEENFLVCSIGKCFQVYRIDRLAVCLISKQTANGVIRAIQVFGHETYCAVGNEIVVYDRTRVVRVYNAHTADITGLVTIGRILLSFDSSNTLNVIDTKDRSQLSSIILLHHAAITSVLHPATYLNKCLIGYADGHLELWNISKQKLVYTFASNAAYFDKNSDKFGETNINLAGIICMEQSPAVDVVAVGYSTGDILLLNLKLDRILFAFKQDGGSVTSISFRTDVGSEKFPFMVSAGLTGRVYVWNLGSKRQGVDTDVDDDDCITNLRLERKLESIMEDAHRGPISSLHFLHGEPVLVSSSVDNSIKMWIFDSPDGSARLLRSREGHSGFPCRIRYYGGVTNASMSDNADGLSCELLSSGSDGTLRLFNTAIEAQNRELSQLPILKKLGKLRSNERLPNIIAFDYSETREQDWGNLVTVHQNHTNAYVWRFRHRVVTELVLRQPGWQTNDLKYCVDRSHHATAAAVSPCGNFCVVGYRNGVVHMYNLQSGLPRGSYPASAITASISVAAKKKREAVPGNVFNMQQELAAEGKNGHAHFLNPKPTTTDNIVEATVVCGHSLEVTGLWVDMASTVLTTCGFDGWVIFWNFETHKEISRIKHSTPQLHLVGFRDAGFVAVAGQDRTVRMFDTSSRKLIRRFVDGHSRQVTDMAFTPDGRRLLSSSLDATVRVWDIPTGRCLSWLSFDAPVLSLTVSHSGEYLCVAQADKEGVFMYVDRSLYETVHFWQEPTIPTAVADSLVQVERGNHDQGDSLGPGTKEGGGGGGSGGTAVQISDGPEIGLEDAAGGRGGVAVVVKPGQAQVVTDAAPDSHVQLGEGAITMSSVPRGYWTSLFNLELIKERNKPTAAPAAPVQAPFFLPTIIRGGSTPSFPTPIEFQKILTESGTGTNEAAAISSSLSTAVSLGKRTEAEAASSLASDRSKKIRVAATEQGRDSVLLQEEELDQLPQVWSDDAQDFDGGVLESTEAVAGLSESSSGRVKGFDGGVDVRPVIIPKRTSKIIKDKGSLPRCKLESFLIRLKNRWGAEESSSDVDAGSNRYTEGLELLAYMSSLAPPAVDVELRALCTHAQDTQGISYLVCFIAWLSSQLAKGTNYELLQAYLHRTLVIYSDTIVSTSALTEAVRLLFDAQKVGCDRLRQLIQTNLCALKLFSGLAPT